MHRLINVDVDPETGKKMGCGERNNLSQDQIRASPGEGNTYSLYLNHMPGIMVLDFDCKQDRWGRKYGAVFRGESTCLGGALIVLSCESDPNSRPVALSLLSVPCPAWKSWLRSCYRGPKKGEITTHSTDSAILFERKESY
jgi:hypothetical protein